MSDPIQDASLTREKLNQRSPSFCLAKWKQVTLHLHNGHNHSCHHPRTHKIPLEELENPTALHNSSFKKEQRKLMLEGTRPEECSFCWAIEDSSGNNLSDRHYKSAQPWASPFFEEIAKSPWDKNFFPSYVEVSFSKTCNLKCSYCGPHNSSQWETELKEGNYLHLGGFATLANEENSANKSYSDHEHNPYIEAFWQWWPELSQHLQVFRLTGGEPLLSEHTFRILEDLNQHPRPQLEIAINSNFSLPSVTVDRLLQLLEPLTSANKVKSVSLHLSIDAFGKQAEYIRHGLNTEKFWNNVERVLNQNPKINVVFMTTFNALSIFSYTELLDHILKLRTKYTLNEKSPSLYVDFTHLHNPIEQSLKILPIELAEEIIKNILFKIEKEFYSLEAAKMKRILDWIKVPLDAPSLLLARARFYQFFSQHDERRKTNLLQAFPEITTFWSTCKDASDFLGEKNIP